MKHETHTIQVWPSGRGYEYRGNSNYGFPGTGGDERRLRANTQCGGTLSRWRKGKASEWAELLVELRVNRYIEIEVLKCDSMLVSDLLQHGSECSHGDMDREWSYDEVTNLYPDPGDWTYDQCREWLDDHGVDHPDAEAEIAAWAQTISDHAEPAEIYEWWAVSDWLARQLTAIGEPVLDNAYGYWWGRTCTGQAMKMDGTLQQIARKYANE